MLPSLPEAAIDENVKQEDEELIPSIHRVVAYSGLTYYQVLELPVDVFMAMLRASVIEEMRESEEGREYLKKCRRLNQTEIDLDGLREFKNERGEI